MHKSVVFKKIALFFVLSSVACQALVYAAESGSNALFFSLLRKALQNNDFPSAVDYVDKIQEQHAEDADIAVLEDNVNALNNAYFVDFNLKRQVLEDVDRIERKYVQGLGGVEQTAISDSVPQSSQADLIKTSEMQKSGDSSNVPEKSLVEIENPPEPWLKKFKERLLGKDYLFYLNKNRPFEQRIRDAEREIESFEVFLDDNLWVTQPKTEVMVKIRQPILIRGNNIKRFLSTRPELLNIRKIDDNTLELTTETYASVPVYVWEDRGRWTIDFKGFSRSSLYRKLGEEDAEHNEIQNVDTFKFKYNVDGNMRYSGTKPGNITKDSNRVLQGLSTEGPSPYGKIDAEAQWRYENSLNGFTYYTLGLTDGDIRGFDKFNARLFDYTFSESSYTFGYSGLRGVYFDKLLLNEYFKWAVFYGKERESTLQSVTDATERDVSYQGSKLDFFDKHDGRYTLNYVSRGGEFLPGATDQAYGFDFVKPIGVIGFNGEFSTDSEDYARVLGANYLNNRRFLGAQFYDIDETYDGIAGPIGDQGRIGSRWSWNLSDWHDWDVNGSSNIYQERSLSLPGLEEKWNYENFSNFRYKFTDSFNMFTSVYYDHLEGGFEPNKYWNVNHSFNKNMMLWGKRSNGFVNFGYVQRRNEIDLSSDYNRYTAGMGLEMNLNDNMVWSNSYQYNIQEDLFSGVESRPSSLTTALSYRKRITDRLKWDWRTSFRKELSSSDSPNFFEASDRLSLAAGIRYKPAPEVETYLSADWDQDINDSRGNDDSDLSIKWGLEADWDSGFSWNPKGVIEGVVYKDFNQNQRQDLDEPGVSGMLVRIGNREITTDDLGRFATFMSAKKVKVVLKNENFPKGYNYSDSFSKNVDVIHNNIHTVFFPISINTSILGYVFLDENANGVLDKNEQSFPNIRITLDGDSQDTDYQGAFFFSGLSGGEHKLRIDVNSIPADYIPKVKIMQKVDVIEGETMTINIPLVPNIKN